MTESAAQTDPDMLSSCGPDCEARFEVKLRDFRARIERELNDQMQVAMKKLEERVCASTHLLVLLLLLLLSILFSRPASPELLQVRPCLAPRPVVNFQELLKQNIVQADCSVTYLCLVSVSIIF